MKTKEIMYYITLSIIGALTGLTFCPSAISYIRSM